MSRVDDLLADLAPGGVRHRPMGEVGSLQRGRRFVKDDITTEGKPCIHYGEIYTRYGSSATSTFSFLPVEMAARLRSAQPGDVIIASAGETIEDIGKAVAWLGSEDVVIHDACYAYRSALDPKFVAYFLQTPAFRSQARRSISSSKISAISLEGLGRARIPVPPLEVQREIVRILDQFAELEAELGAELEARRQQYAHYRDKLTAGARDSSPVRFGDVARIVRGASPRPIARYVTRSPDGVPWIKIGDVGAEDKYVRSTAERVTREGAARSRTVLPGDFILSNSMSFGRPYIVDLKGCIHDGWLAISDYGSTFTTDYLYHLLRSKAIATELHRRASNGTVQNLNSGIVQDLELAAPPLDEQLRITTILDKFDALVNDLSSGLPAEIAARRQQYEHYRDRLLTFKEAPS